MTTAVSSSPIITSVRAKPLTQAFLFTLGVFFLLAMHYFQHNAGGSGLELSFNAAAWIPLGLTLGVGLFEIARQKQWRYTRLTIALFLGCAFMTIPIFYSHANVEGALLRLLGLWGGFLFFVCLQQFVFQPHQKERLLWFILGATLIEALIGWMQFLWLEPGNFMGYDAIANRPYGIFQQPNVMASFLATGLMVSGYLFPRLSPLTPLYRHKQILCLLTPALLLPLIIIIGSRTGWLGSAIGIVLLLPYYLTQTKKHQKWLAACAMALALLLSWGITSPTFNPNAAQQAAQRVEERLNLNSARSIHIPQAWQMFLKKPWGGYGYGNFEAAYLLQTAQWHHDDPQNNAYGLAALDHPHNELLYWAAEGGIVPILGILLAGSAVLWRMTQAKKGTRLALIALITPLVIHSQLEYPFYHSIAHWITFLILLYWMDSLTAKRSKIALNYVLTLRVMALLLPVLIGGFMISTLYSGHQLTTFETQRKLNIEPLLKVNNPWAWQNRFEWDLHLLQLQLGEVTQKREFVEKYVGWAEEKAKTWPRVALYRNLILAQQLLGETEKAKHLQQEAQFLFPNQRFKLKKNPSPIS